MFKRQDQMHLQNRTTQYVKMAALIHVHYYLQ